LYVVEDETAEDGESSVECNGLRDGERSHGGDGKDHGCERRESDNGQSGEKRSSHVEVLVVLGRGANEAKRSDDTESVETSWKENGDESATILVNQFTAAKKPLTTAEQSRRHEEQGSQSDGLRRLEEREEGHLLKVVLRRRGPDTPDSGEPSSDTDSQDRPRVHQHDSVRNSVGVEGVGGSGSHGESESTTVANTNFVSGQASIESWRKLATYVYMKVELRCDRSNGERDSRVSRLRARLTTMVPAPKARAIFPTFAHPP
jgi:hypothetical protein